MSAGRSAVLHRDRRDAASAPGPLAVCYEASCGYGALYDVLSPLAQRVVVAHPGLLRLIFRSKRKNDRVDAEKLAKLLYLQAGLTAHDILTSATIDNAKILNLHHELGSVTKGKHADLVLFQGQLNH